MNVINIVRSFIHPQHGRLFYGKKPATRRLKTICLGNVMNVGALPAAPNAWGYEYLVGQSAWGMMGNGPDTLNGQPFSGAGCCVVATAGHFIKMWTANTGNPIAPTTDQVIGVYSALTGFNPATGENDTGLDEQTFLDYWKSTGIPCTDSNGNTTVHKILGYASVDVSNILLLNQATWIFEGLFCGIQCPESAEEDTSNWIEVPGSPIVGGHGVPRVGMGRDGGHFVSWGLSIPHDNQFLVSNLDEAYVVVSEDQLNLQGKNVPGFDQPTLLSMMAQV